MAFRNNPVVYLTMEMWRYSEGNRKKVVLYSLMFIVANIIGLTEPLVVALLLNTVQEQGITAANLNYLLAIIGLFVAIEVGFWAFHGPARVMENNNAFRVRSNYKKRMLEGMMSLPMEWHTEHHSGDTIDKIEKGSHSLFDYSSNTWGVIRIIVSVISAYIILVFFNIHSAYIVAALIVLMFLTLLRFDKSLIGKWARLYKAENAISARVYDVISNISTVIILRLEKLSSAGIVRKITAPYGLYKQTNKLNEAKWFIVSLVGVAMMAMVMASYILGSLYAGTPVLIGTLYALYGYVQRIRSEFFELAWRYSEIVRWKTAVHNAEEISREFREKPAITPIDLTRSWKGLHINKLSFNYQGTEGELHLNNVSLEIRRGEKIALVGESGSGKTTFLKLIRALYKPRHVAIAVNGKKLNSFDALAPNITLVPQDPELFDASIKENIAMGMPYSLAKIRKYTGMAMFTQVAERLPKKFNSHIKEKGVNLSTGEKQRLALARGLLAAEKTPILLLDEPTSSVDSANEMEIYKNIFSAFRNKTIISSVHRLHLLPHFDKIYVFKKGRIIARGSLKEVLKNREFRKMWKKYTRKESMHVRF
ncbi:MAG: ABC transporter ATP-binding protein [Candidatus Aenigmarchaeota archaeon]|nr:ABC transporter ATP-binding protein [Candidatus Aenigmarchaeota archaeon]